MSTFNLFKGNFLVLPKFDILLYLNSGKSIYLDDKYTKWFFFFSFACSAAVVFNFAKMIVGNVKRLINNMRVPSSIGENNENRFVVVLGFGDTQASIIITKFFSYLGYNILAICDESTLQYRKEKNKDQLEEITRLKTRIIQLTYEEFLTEYKQKLHEAEEIKFDFLFECSLMREAPVDKFNTSAASLNFKLIKSKISEFYKILSELKSHFSSCKLFIMDYFVKHGNVNQKLLADFKYDLMNNCLFNNKKVVESLSRIKIKNKFNKLPLDKFEKIYLNLNSNSKHQNFYIE